MKNKDRGRQKHRAQVMLTAEQHRYLVRDMKVSDKLRRLIDLDMAINLITSSGLTLGEMQLYINNQKG